jgi:hypothetical protein
MPLARSLWSLEHAELAEEEAASSEERGARKKRGWSRL